MSKLREAFRQGFKKEAVSNKMLLDLIESGGLNRLVDHPAAKSSRSYIQAVVDNARRMPDLPKKRQHIKNKLIPDVKETIEQGNELKKQTDDLPFDI